MSTDNGTERLRHEYDKAMGDLTRLKQSMQTELATLLSVNSITLGVPIECRIKEWSSIDEKCQRKGLSLQSVQDLDDLVGARLILLFLSDRDRVDELIKRAFPVITSEDVASRLEDTKFGYQSNHYVVNFPSDWAKAPTMKGLDRYKIEIQVRTMAQHIWAAVSHKLQYKRETSVPGPLKRAIHRASALLEVVDLEFQRVLEERQDYVDSVATDNTPNLALDVELLKKILTEILPERNRVDGEPYSDLLEDLRHWKVNTTDDLQQLWNKQKDAVIKADIELAKKQEGRTTADASTSERAKQGVFRTHTGLIREAIRIDNGITFDDWKGRPWSSKKKRS